MGNLEMSQTSIDDHRKFAIWVILAPYLIDVKYLFLDNHILCPDIGSVSLTVF